MKHKVRVTMHYVVEVEFNPSQDMQETLKEFNECMFSCESEEELAKFTATQVARNGGSGFVEGVGKCGEAYWDTFTDDPAPDALVSIEVEEVESEIVNE